MKPRFSRREAEAVEVKKSGVSTVVGEIVIKGVTDDREA